MEPEVGQGKKGSRRVAQEREARTLVAPVVVVLSSSKQEVFLRCKNPGRPLASLFSPLRGALAFNPNLPYVY